MSEQKTTFGEKLKNFFGNIITKIKVWTRNNRVIQKIFWIIRLIFHYIGYIFWPLKKFKEITYDRMRYGGQRVVIYFVFLTPAILGFLLFFAYPLVLSFVYSFSSIQRVEGGINVYIFKQFADGVLNQPGYINAEPINTSIWFNYIYAFREHKDFTVKLFNTIGDTVINTLVITIFSLLIAVMLNGKFRGRTLARAIFFLPVVFNSEAVSSALEAAASYSTILNRTGANALTSIFDLKAFLGNLGVPAGLTSFLGGITNTIYNTISYSGIQILIFLAAIQSVPGHLYEAAKIEGATKYESFWKITLPMVSPMILIVVVYTIVDSFLRSDINTTIEKQYELVNYGQHAAMSWIYFLVSALLLGIIVGILSKVVFYYDEKK